MKLRLSSVGLPLLLLGGTWAAAAPSDPLAPEVFQITAREIWIAPGKVLKDAVLVVEGDRVRSVEPASGARSDEPLLRYDGVLTAGLVACRTQSATHSELQDDTRTVLDRARAAHAVDEASSDLERALAAGITALVLSPGSANLVGGIACVVRSSDGAVLAPEAGLALSLSADALGRSTAGGGFAFGSAEEPVAGESPGACCPPELKSTTHELLHASRVSGIADGSPEFTRFGGRGTRAPTSYSGAVATLRQLFSRGEGAFQRAREGELAVTIEAWHRHEILRAVELAKELGLRGAVRGAPRAGDADVVAALKESGLGVLLGPYGPNQSAESLAALKRLAEGGIRVGFALDAPFNSPDELRMTAARTLRAGAGKDAVWRALTEDAAVLSGVGDSVGKLEPGYRADFVVWSGDPLDLSSRILAVFVDGKRAWPRPVQR